MTPFEQWLVHHSVLTDGLSSETPWLHVSAKGQWNGTTVAADDPEAAWAYFERAERQGRDSYVRVAPLMSPPPTEQRGGARLSPLVHVLAMDIDCAAPGHKAENLPDRATARHLIMRGPRPSLIVDTGGGFHVYVTLVDPLDLRVDEDAELFARWVPWWQAHMTGWHVDAVTASSAAILRPAGSWSAKQQRRVEIVHSDLLNLHSRGDLERLLADTQAAPGMAPSRKRRAVGTTGPVGSAAKGMDPGRVAADVWGLVPAAGVPGRWVLPHDDGTVTIGESHAGVWLADDGAARLTIFGERLKQRLSLPNDKTTFRSIDIVAHALGDPRLARTLLAGQTDWTPHLAALVKTLSHTNGPGALNTKAAS